ncbi:hypothetical protein Tco_1413580 [Tanacetum coccineum]
MPRVTTRVVPRGLPAVTGATTGQWWSTAVVNGGQRRSTVADHRRTIAGPLPDHRRTTCQRWLTASQLVSLGPGQVRSWAGSGRDLGRVGSGSATWCHVSADVAADVAWRGLYPSCMNRTLDLLV